MRKKPMTEAQIQHKREYIKAYRGRMKNGYIPGRPKELREPEFVKKSELQEEKEETGRFVLRQNNTDLYLYGQSKKCKFPVVAPKEKAYIFATKKSAESVLKILGWQFWRIVKID